MDEKKYHHLLMNFLCDEAFLCIDELKILLWLEFVFCYVKISCKDKSLKTNR